MTGMNVHRMRSASSSLFGIDVSIIEPGPIATEFNDRAMETIDTSAFTGSPYAPLVAQAEAFRKRFEAQSAGPLTKKNLPATTPAPALTAPAV